MQTQHISELYPNVISITQIRKDIDSLTKLLGKYSRIKVLRGQEVAFEVVRPETKEERLSRVRNAVDGIRKIATEMGRKRLKKSLTQLVIEERDLMQTKKYYEEHNR